jgi:hypothetical protein
MNLPSIKHLWSNLYFTFLIFFQFRDQLHSTDHYSKQLLEELHELRSANQKHIDDLGSLTKNNEQLIIENKLSKDTIVKAEF